MTLARADKSGLCCLEIGESPVFVDKWNAEAKVVAKESDASDSAPAPINVKLYVERRDRVIVVNGPKPASAEPVILGGLWAEYAKESDKTKEAVRLDRLAMLPPANNLRHENPIADASALRTGQLTVD